MEAATKKQASVSAVYAMSILIIFYSFIQWGAAPSAEKAVWM